MPSLLASPPEQALLGRQTVDLVRTEVVLFALSQADREIREYRLNGEKEFGLDRSHSVWFDWIKGELLKLAIVQKVDALPYQSRDVS